jgi:hypothetical protein
MFHPKLYLFHERDQRLAWVGSANLTRAGFQQNQELVTEFADDGAASGWFEQLWSACDPDCSAQVNAYVSGWKPPAFGSWTGKAAANGAVGTLPKTLPREWPAYVAALLAANAYWEPVFQCTVTGDFRSWLSTIELGRALMRRESWDSLTEDEYRLALGIERDRNGYGLLGSMWGAGYAKNVFRVSAPANLEVRRSIRAALQPVLDASDGDFPMAAAEFIQAVNAHQGFAGALATRFMTLARPDRAVSVNRGSRRKLADFLDLPETSLSKPKGYKALLARLSDLPWYESPTPKGAFEELLASNRAALVDALVYEVQ